MDDYHSAYELLTAASTVVHAACHLSSLTVELEADLGAESKSLAQATEVLLQRVRAACHRVEPAKEGGAPENKVALVGEMLTEFLDASTADLQGNVLFLIRSVKAFLSDPNSFSTQSMRCRSLESVMNDIEALVTAAGLLLSPQDLLAKPETLSLLVSASHICTEANAIMKGTKPVKHALTKGQTGEEVGEAPAAEGLTDAVKEFLRLCGSNCTQELKDELRDAVVSLVRNMKRVTTRTERTGSTLDQVKLEVATILQAISMSCIHTMNESALPQEDKDVIAAQPEEERRSFATLFLLNRHLQRNTMQSVVCAFDAEVPWFRDQWETMSSEEQTGLVTRLARLLPQHSSPDHRLTYQNGLEARVRAETASKPSAPASVAEAQARWRAQQQGAQPGSGGQQAGPHSRPVEKTDGSKGRRGRGRSRKTGGSQPKLQRTSTTEMLLGSELVRLQRVRNAQTLTAFAEGTTAVRDVLVSRPVLLRNVSSTGDIMTVLSAFRPQAATVYQHISAPYKKMDVLQIVVQVQATGEGLRQLVALAGSLRIQASQPSWIDSLEDSTVKGSLMLLDMTAVEQQGPNDLLIANARAGELEDLLLSLHLQGLYVKYQLHAVSVLVETFALTVQVGDRTQGALYRLLSALREFIRLAQSLICIYRTKNVLLDDLAAEKRDADATEGMTWEEDEANVWEQVGRPDLSLVTNTASLNELLIMLTRTKVQDSCNELVTLVLATYSTFCTPATLFSKLKEVYLVPASMPEKERHRVQAAVLFFLTRWLVAEPTAFPASRLAAMSDMAEQSTDKSLSKAKQALVAAIDASQVPRSPHACRVVAFSSSIAIVPPSDTFMDIEVASIARTLTLIDFSLFEMIQPRELLKLSWSKPKTRHRAPNVTAMIARLNAVAQWVASVIVWPEKMQERCRRLERFVAVAVELEEMQNFNSMQAILGAINMTPIQRLKHTHQLVSPKAKAELKRLQGLLSSTRNWGAYRDHIASCSPPAVPYLGIFCTDLTFTVDGNPDQVDGKINLKKRRMIYRIIADMTRFQGIAYPFKAEHPAFSLLASVPAFDEEQLYQCSLLREPRSMDTRTLQVLEKDKP